MKKDVNYYLMKLGIYETQFIDTEDIGIHSKPDNVFYDKWSGRYFRIIKNDMTADELDFLLRARNAHSLNIIKLCVIIVTLCLIVTTASVLLQ